VLAQVRAKRQNSHNSSLCGCKDTIMAGVESLSSTQTIDECKERHDEVIGVWDRIDIYRGVGGQGEVGNIKDCLSVSWCSWEKEGAEDSWVGPCEIHGDAESGEGGREEGG